jgi:hypothetical protein
MSLHRERTHPEEVDGCFGCKISALQLNPGEASTRTSMSTKKWDGELQAYRNARAQGIQPASTQMKDIKAAVAASNHFGKAFKADEPGRGLI